MTEVCVEGAGAKDPAVDLPAVLAAILADFLGAAEITDGSTEALADVRLEVEAIETRSRCLAVYLLTFFEMLTAFFLTNLLTFPRKYLTGFSMAVGKSVMYPTVNISALLSNIIGH